MPTNFFQSILGNKKLVGIILGSGLMFSPFVFALVHAIPFSSGGDPPDEDKEPISLPKQHQSYEDYYGKTFILSQVISMAIKLRGAAVRAVNVHPSVVLHPLDALGLYIFNPFALHNYTLGWYHPTNLT